ncbi:MAG: phosphatase PAP2 family protein [Gammaproteobacteria bacterium]|nr:phosphatase PAP2 family protein [Gammaproteobacteria bacterium]MCH9745037.1 phosphatase PAP2 family protein [Gammaproteobacteria bacterium]
MKTQTITALILLLATSLLFILVPKIDIGVSQLFFQDHHFKVFYRPFMIIRTCQHIILAIMSLFLIKAIYTGFKNHNKQPILAALFIISVFALGPGLIVNLILKNHSGRPRPYTTNLYGGQLQFKKPWQFSHECSRNCSFASGECSTAFAFFALLFLIKKKRLKLIAATIISMNFILTSYIRLAMGGHYLSDIVIGALLTYLVMLGCYQFFLHRVINVNKLAI